MTFPAPVRPYVGPPKFRGAATNKPIRRIVMHGTVSPCEPGGARRIASYFRHTVRRPSSCHYIVDPVEALQLTWDSVVAFHAPPNESSIGVELCERVTGPIERWNDKNHQDMLALAAKLVAELCLAYEVPIRWVTADQLRAGVRGITDHDEVSKAWRQTNHWDLGEWPRFKFIAMVKAEAAKLQAPKQKEPKPKPEPVPLRFAHCSLQAHDSDRQKQSDANKLFKRCARRRTSIVTGTEAGPERAYLGDAARENGYRFTGTNDAWVAVDKALIAGNWTTGFVPVIKSSESRLGKHTHRGIVWAAFDTEELGRITVGAAHFLRKGRPGTSGPNLKLNRRFGPALKAWVKEAGAGSGLAFYGGDQNIPDKPNDVFFGAPLTTAWDELSRYQSTGHGCIDVIASYDKDGRVEAEWIKALPDDKFHLHTDHFLVEAMFNVRPLKRKSAA